MKRLLIVLMLIALTAPAMLAQTTGDTLIIEVGKSRLMFIVNDTSDVAKIKNYDLNKIIQRLQATYTGDSVIVLTMADVQESRQDTLATDRDTREPEKTEIETGVIEVNYDRVGHYFNFELGMNNYLEDGSTPSSSASYNVRPWGSWYVAFGSVNEFKLSRSLSLQGGINLSWYNFKFQNDDTYVIRGDESVEFVANPEGLDASFKKSKLTVAYLNASLVPVIRLGKSSDAVRLGAGMYAGYRIGSYMKVKYDDGNNEKKKNHDSFYLNDFRYGLRFQAGFGGLDLFFNYDLNELFREGRGPTLNAISFGIIF